MRCEVIDELKHSTANQVWFFFFLFFLLLLYISLLLFATIFAIFSTFFSLHTLREIRLLPLYFWRPPWRMRVYLLRCRASSFLGLPRN